jgi:AcrR family transcriptional regulator
VDQEQQPEPRDRLLDAGRTVLQRVGYASATVDDVVAEAGASRATFYRHFHGKEELFAALSRQCFTEMSAVIEEFSLLPIGAGAGPGGAGGAGGGGAGGVERVERLLARYRQLHARHGGVIRAWFERDLHPDPELQDRARETFGRFIESLARPLVAAGTPSAVDVDVRAALLYLLIERSYYGVSSRWSRIDPDRLAPTLATMIHRAYLAGPPAPRATRLRIGES